MTFLRHPPIIFGLIALLILIGIFLPKPLGFIISPDFHRMVVLMGGISDPLDGCVYHYKLISASPPKKKTCTCGSTSCERYELAGWADATHFKVKVIDRYDRFTEALVDFNNPQIPCN